MLVCERPSTSSSLLLCLSFVKSRNVAVDPICMWNLLQDRMKPTHHHVQESSQFVQLQPSIRWKEIVLLFGRKEVALRSTRRESEWRQLESCYQVSPKPVRSKEMIDEMPWSGVLGCHPWPRCETLPAPWILRFNVYQTKKTNHVRCEQMDPFRANGSISKTSAVFRSACSGQETTQSVQVSRLCLESSVMTQLK